MTNLHDLEFNETLTSADKYESSIYMMINYKTAALGRILASFWASRILASFWASRILASFWASRILASF